MISLDGPGGATVVWTRERWNALFPRSTVLVATRQPRQRFEAPRIVDTDGVAPALAGNASGQTVLVWQHVDPVGNTARTGVVVAATRSSAASGFGSYEPISAPLHQPHNQYYAPTVEAAPAAAVAPDGTMLVSWTRTDGSAPYCCTAVEVAFRRPSE